VVLYYQLLITIITNDVISKKRWRGGRVEERERERDSTDVADVCFVRSITILRTQRTEDCAGHNRNWKLQTKRGLVCIIFYFFILFFYPILNSVSLSVYKCVRRRVYCESVSARLLHEI